MQSDQNEQPEEFEEEGEVEGEDQYGQKELSEEQRQDTEKIQELFNLFKM